MKLLHLIRWKDLLVVALCQFLMREAIIRPILGLHGYAPMASTTLFFLLILSTVLILAGGYVINDYFDTRTDAINRPERRVVGKHIPRRQAMIVHQVLTFLGVLIGLGVAYVIKEPFLAGSVILIPGLLWFFSSTYKRQFLIGDLLIAFLAGMVPMVVLLFETELLMRNFGPELRHTGLMNTIFFWVLTFSLFFFLLVLILRILKHCENEEGEREMEFRSLPIVTGHKVTKVVLSTLMIVLGALLSWVYFSYLAFPGETLSLRYLLFGFGLPMLFWFYFLIKAKGPIDYKVLIGLVNFLIAVGLGFSIVANMVLSKQAHGDPFHEIIEMFQLLF